jgi:hypothetical protein
MELVNMAIKNWREVKEGKTIFKFDRHKDNETLVLNFLSEGVLKTFQTKRYNDAHVVIGFDDAESYEFQCEFNDKIGVFSTGSSRCLVALQGVAPDLTNKRIKIVKTGLGMATTYTAELMK